MKLSCVRNIQENKRNNLNNVNNNSRYNPNFTGFASGCAAFWKFVDNGGRALQFTVEDCAETNFPRSLKGLFAGYKYTGKLNILAFLQEAIREFLTGPTMCVTPIAILALATKFSGKTANTHTENISNLAYLTGKTQIENAKEFAPNFFSVAVEDMLKQTLGIKENDIKENDIKTLVEGLTKYNAETNKKEASKILADLQNEFEKIVKREKSSYKNTNFLNASYSVAKDKTGTTSFKNYMGYISAWADDFGKKLNKDNLSTITSDAIKSFKKTWIGKRMFVAGSMFGITALLMSFVPKLYTLASGSINPNATVIYSEAGKDGKDDKQPQGKEVK